MARPKQTKVIHRINIGLPIDVYEALQGYAEFIGKPPATVASEMIQGMQPTMLAVTRAMEKARKDKESGINELRQIVLQEISKAAADASLSPENQPDLFDEMKERIS